MDKNKLTKNYYALKSRCLREFGTLGGTILESKQIYLNWICENKSEDKCMLVRRDTSVTYSTDNCYMGTRQDFYKTRGTSKGTTGHRYITYDRHYAGYLYRRNNRALFASKDLTKVLEFKEEYEKENN